MTARYFSHRVLNVFNLELEEWKYPLHKHNFFEIIFITAGNGKQRLNDILFDYKEGDVFFLGPEDEHEFIIEQKTTFSYIKFTELLFDQLNGRWKNEIEKFLANANILPGDTIANETDRIHIFYLLKVLQYEYTQHNQQAKALCEEIMSSILLLITRGVNEKNKSVEIRPNNDHERVQALLSYIRTFLLDKDKMKIAVIAEEFAISPTYVSEFFKKHTGESLQQYIINSKLKMAERLLKQSNLTISLIADRLGFNDASHFTKAFSSTYHLTPGQFRKGLNPFYQLKKDSFIPG